MTEPLRRLPPPGPDVRVGSATNALVPLSRAERILAAGPFQWLALVLVFSSAVAGDQLTKAVVSRTLALGEAVDLTSFLQIHHVRNSGIAFGLFADGTAVVIGLTGVAVAAMVWFFRRSAQRHRLLPTAFGLVLGGSVSNLIDRVRLGNVTDFIDPSYWPAFNLADTFIVVGVATLFWSFVAADQVSPRTGGRYDR